METVTTSPWSGGEPLPERLRRVLEQLSGYDLSDVRVYSRSHWPARIGARAFVLGSDIHLSPGAGDALEHEAWHVVQQKQGRVRETGPARFAEPPFSGAGLNDSEALEREADMMGLVARSLARRGEAVPVKAAPRVAAPRQPVLQRQVTVLGVEISDAATFREEIKNRLALMGFNVTGFADIVADMLNEKLVFATWTDVKREILIREVGYQAVDVMRALAVEHQKRFLTAEERYKTELSKTKFTGTMRTKTQAREALEKRIYEDVGVIRWSNASYIKYQCRNRQMFRWAQGTRNEDPFLMNCWEAVLYSLVKTGLVHKSYITWCNQPDPARNSDMPKLSNPNNLAASMLRNMDYYFWATGNSAVMARQEKRIPPVSDKASTIIQIPKDRVIPKGRVLMFGLSEHVALSTGTLQDGEHGILELDGGTNTIQESTIERLSEGYRASMVVAPFPICPKGSVKVTQEDTDKKQQRTNIRSEVAAEYQVKKDNAAALSNKKIAELERQKEVPGNLQFEGDINALIAAERKAGQQEQERLDAEASQKVETLFGKYLDERTPPTLEVITLQYEACDPYEGQVVLL